MSIATHTRRRAALALLVALARPDGGRAFVGPTPPLRPAAPTSLFATPSVGVFFGTSTGGTEDAAYLVSAALGDVASDPIDIDEAQGSVAAEFARFESLVVGTPTWNTGADTERSGVGWDEIYYSEMQELNIAGKKVAVFGLGDSVSYAENYADATGELFDVFESLGCTMLGASSQEGYQHEASKAIRGDAFCGLLLDAVNEEDLTEERVGAWASRLLAEGIAEGGGAASALPSVAAAPVAAPPPQVETAASVVFEDHALAEEIMAEVTATRKGYVSHYNKRSDRTMWISTDGRSSYVTAGKPGYE